MNINEVEFEDIADEVGAEIRAAYSGRAMFGETCVALTGDISEIRVGVALAKVLGVDKAERLARRARVDSMGHDIVVYFPGVEVIS